jgi:hypothetical protein
MKSGTFVKKYRVYEMYQLGRCLSKINPFRIILAFEGEFSTKSIAFICTHTYSLFTVNSDIGNEQHSTKRFFNLRDSTYVVLQAGKSETRGRCYGDHCFLAIFR